jgi:acyl-lipid omega-6 desaturase (Delta-12 desaturase)
MNRFPTADDPLPKMSELNKVLAPYQKANTRHSIFQLANTLIPYVILWVLMVYSLKISYALTLALDVIAAGFMVRLFIFFHDCGHNSFFPTVRANRLVGFWLGLLVFTPGEHWWHSHAIHHATSGNLDKRGQGDVTTLTVDEFYETKWPGKFGYKLFRNPLVMFGLGPFYMFVISHRLNMPKYGPRETRSVVLTNLGILAMAIGLSLVIGWKAYLMIQIPLIWIGGMGGIWMFYIQHQFEDTYWEREESWNYVASALLGASFYKLPKLMQWFTGSIGYHHIHHLSPRIPNYNLEPAHDNIPMIQKWTRVVTWRESLHYTRLKVWDEQLHKMTGFGRKTKEPQPAGSASAVKNPQSFGD